MEIGLLKNATDEQFIALFNLRKSGTSQETESTFVMKNKDMKFQSIKDVQELKDLQVAPKQISDKLERIVQKAEAVYAELVALGVPFTQDPIIDVEEDGKFRVTGFATRINGQAWCQFCSEALLNPRTFEIQNATTHEEISLREIFIHLISTHEYFGRESTRRIDPTTACRVLGLNKQHEQRVSLEANDRRGFLESPNRSPTSTSCCVIL